MSDCLQTMLGIAGHHTAGLYKASGITQTKQGYGENVRAIALAPLKKQCLYIERHNQRLRVVLTAD